MGRVYKWTCLQELQSLPVSVSQLSCYIMMLILPCWAKHWDGREFGRWEGEEEVLWQIDHEQNKFTTFSWVFDYPKNCQEIELLFHYSNYSLLLGCLPDWFLSFFFFWKKKRLTEVETADFKNDNVCLSYTECMKRKLWESIISYIHYYLYRMSLNLVFIVQGM